MSINFHLLANPGVRSLTPYQPGKTIEEVERELGITSSIKLASNENPLGASPKAMLAAEKALLKMSCYPDGHCFELKKSLATSLGVAKEQITLGNGSENILELIIKSYCHKNTSAVISQYAFLTIPILLQSYEVKTHVAVAHDFGHDINAMLAAITDDTKIVFLVNPNNPTGTYTSQQDFLRLLNALPLHVILVVDEAYAEYITNSDCPQALNYLPHYPNLIVTRTFSKIYGLAGLRLGYAISSADIADILNRARLPFNVNAIAAQAACAALTDEMHVQQSKLLNQQGMQQLEIGLQQLNISYIPSIGNFIAIDVGDAMMIYQQLLLAGIIVRPLNAYDMPHHIRVTVGTAEQNDRFLKALQKIALTANDWKNRIMLATS